MEHKMRIAAVCAMATALSLTSVAARAQNAATDALNSAATSAPCPGNPEPLGVARMVEIDTTGGPGFGFAQFKAYDFLRDGEVVLTFDDGPWSGNTPAVLKALAAQCTKAVFFPIGKHAMWHPEILKQVADGGHTIGSHTWSHLDLSKLPFDQAFRFPALRHSPELLSYLGTRNVGIFSTDVDSFDFKTHKPEAVIASVMMKLKNNGKGIVLMHDFQHATALALPELLLQLKANGYKIVQVKTKAPVTTLAAYDQQLEKDLGGETANPRAISSVVRTIDVPNFNDRFSAIR
jgi:peptidoglycan/xylan/chitin deacetylase (PgdA/CDA1 family)